MKTPRPYCAVCERPFDADVVQQECGLCGLCSAAEPLVNAFREGQGNLRAAAEAEMVKL